VLVERADSVADPGGSVEKSRRIGQCTGFVEISLQKEQTPFPSDRGGVCDSQFCLRWAPHTISVYSVKSFYESIRQTSTCLSLIGGL
jgi:hypothetical protein